MDITFFVRSLGSSVRDAAAYACWAVSRSYPPAVVAPVIARLAPALLSAAVLDREVGNKLPNRMIGIRAVTSLMLMPPLPSSAFSAKNVCDHTT